MSDFIFNNYIWFSWSIISVSFAALILGMLFTVKERKIQQTVKAVLVFLALMALGMSDNIKHLNLIGFAHALIAIVITFFAIKHFRTQVAHLLWVPCLLIAIVVIFNLLNSGIGLELLGRWE
jgi:NAD/NADP transhydrogenase beta subunit